MNDTAAPASDAPNRNRIRAALSVALGVAAAVWLHGLLARVVTDGMTQSYDTLLYARSLWGIAHGEPMNPVYGTHWLAVHANGVMALTAPLAHAMPAWRVLLLGHALAFGATVALTLRACMAAARAPTATSPPWLGGLAAVWALTLVAAAPVVNPFFFDARPDLVAAPLLLAALLRASSRGGWDGWAYAALVAAGMVREEFAAIGAASLVLSPPRADRGWDLRRRLLFALPLLAWFAAYWFAVRPGLLDGYGGARANQAVADLFAPTSPGAHRYRLGLTVALLGFGGGFALRGWRWLGPALPGLAFVALTTKQASDALNFHYLMFAAPALIAAAVHGLRSARETTSVRTFAAALALATALGAALSATYAAHPWGARFQAQNFAADPDDAQWLAECHAALDGIPSDEGVAVVGLFGAPFADRADVWSLETLTAHLREHGSVPDEVRWVVLDNNRFATVGRVLVTRAGFRIVRIAAGRIGVFHRPSSLDSPPPILSALELAPCTRRVAEWPDAGIAVCDVAPRADGRLEATVTRYRPRQSGAPPLALTVEVDGNGTPLLALDGLIDPATLPLGGTVRAVTTHRVAHPEPRIHVQDLYGRSYAAETPDGPVLGVPIRVPPATP